MPGRELCRLFASRPDEFRSFGKGGFFSGEDYKKVDIFLSISLFIIYFCGFKDSVNQIDNE
jgi:hypothetical protein